MTKRIAIGALSYLIPTFALGFVWHLVAFQGYYARVFAPCSSTTRAFGYAAFGAALSWSFTTIAVAAKNVMSPDPLPQAARA